MDTQSNNLNWFEIPANDINRAKKFYEDVFGIDMETNEMMNMKMAFFPYEMGSGKAAGGLVQSDQHKPSMDGTVVYLNANPDLNNALGKIETAGGQIIMPKTQISDGTGHMASFGDSGGNTMALHSQR